MNVIIDVEEVDAPLHGLAEKNHNFCWPIIELLELILLALKLWGTQSLRHNFQIFQTIITLYGIS